MDSWFSSLLNASRSKKRALTLLIDSVFIFSAFWLALVVRLDSFSPFFVIENWLLLSLLLPVSLLAFIKVGLYRAVLRYVGAHAVGAVIVGTVISTVALVMASFFTYVTIPRTMPLIYAWLLILSVGGSRIAVRAMVSRLATVNKTPVVVYGAGSAGRQLAPAIAAGEEYYVSAFIDDDPSKHGAILQGIPVIAFEGIFSLIERNRVKKILLAMPGESRSRRKEILAQLENLPVEVMTIPGMVDIVEGRATLEEIKDVEIEDLLGRDPVSPKQDLLDANIKGKSVMVTGAGGSIGSELCRQIIKQSPAKLVLFELTEFALYSIEKELSEIGRASCRERVYAPV